MRTPPRPEYADAADALRVRSILMVAWFHIWQQSWLSPSLAWGWRQIDLTGYVRTGYMFVDLMLVLSGFLTYLPYADDRPPEPRKFYLKRFCPVTGCA